MYKHLLVPLDNTPLSTALVTSAIEMARSVGARVTFFHARADWASTSDGALMKAMDPALFSEAAQGAANAVLMKAAAAAKAAGVPCKAIARTDDHPADAIVEAARDEGCDLIMMASHGRASAWSRFLHDSLTEGVLRRAPAALLVTRVEAERPLSNRERAVGTIGDEHRSIAAVVSAMRDIANDLAMPRVAGADVVAELDAVAAMVSYLRDFPEKVHHPKEEAHLHRLMRARDPSCEALLADVEAQHVEERRLVERIGICLAGGPARRDELREAVLHFADHVYGHLKFEETLVLPHAGECLDDDDWREIAEAFADTDDGRFGDLGSKDLRRVFVRIANAVAARGAMQAG